MDGGEVPDPLAAWYQQDPPTKRAQDDFSTPGICAFSHREAADHREEAAGNGLLRPWRGCASPADGLNNVLRARVPTPSSSHAQLSLARGEFEDCSAGSASAGPAELCSSPSMTMEADGIIDQFLLSIAGGLGFGEDISDVRGESEQGIEQSLEHTGFLGTAHNPLDGERPVIVNSEKGLDPFFEKHLGDISASKEELEQGIEQSLEHWIGDRQISHGFCGTAQGRQNDGMGTGPQPFDPSMHELRAVWMPNLNSHSGGVCRCSHCCVCVCGYLSDSYPLDGSRPIIDESTHTGAQGGFHGTAQEWQGGGLGTGPQVSDICLLNRIGGDISGAKQELEQGIDQVWSTCGQELVSFSPLDGSGPIIQNDISGVKGALEQGIDQVWSTGGMELDSYFPLDGSRPIIQHDISGAKQELEQGIETSGAHHGFLSTIETNGFFRDMGCAATRLQALFRMLPLDGERPVLQDGISDVKEEHEQGIEQVWSTDINQISLGTVSGEISSCENINPLNGARPGFLSTASEGQGCGMEALASGENISGVIGQLEQGIDQIWSTDGDGKSGPSRDLDLIGGGDISGVIGQPEQGIEQSGTQEGFLSAAEQRQAEALEGIRKTSDTAEAYISDLVVSGIVRYQFELDFMAAMLPEACQQAHLAFDCGMEWARNRYAELTCIGLRCTSGELWAIVNSNKSGPSRDLIDHISGVKAELEQGSNRSGARVGFLGTANKRQGCDLTASKSGSSRDLTEDISGVKAEHGKGSSESGAQDGFLSTAEERQGCGLGANCVGNTESANGTGSDCNISVSPVKELRALIKAKQSARRKQKQKA